MVLRRVRKYRGRGRDRVQSAWFSWLLLYDLKTKTRSARAGARRSASDICSSAEASDLLPKKMEENSNPAAAKKVENRSDALFGELTNEMNGESPSLETSPSPAKNP